MAMTVPGMTTAIKNALLANSPMATVDQLSLALATAIVIYIQANAVVPGTGLTAPVGGGPVTGNAAVT